jgi:peptidyl-prolyl cis-trans isomerase SurA
VEDTVGLENFYGQNKENYMWGERIDASIYNNENKDLIKKARLTLKKMSNYDNANEELSNTICDTSNIECLNIESGKFSKGDNAIIDQVTWKAGVSKIIMSDNNFSVVLIKELLLPEIKKLSEARGIITADYQNYLEKEWIKDLRLKYEIKINQEVLDTIL